MSPAYMIEEIIELLPGIAALTPVQFLILLFGLAASVFFGFLVKMRLRILVITMRALATQVWGVSWVSTNNALVEWAI